LHLLGIYVGRGCAEKGAGKSHPEGHRREISTMSPKNQKFERDGEELAGSLDDIRYQPTTPALRSLRDVPKDDAGVFWLENIEHWSQEVDLYVRANVPGHTLLFRFG
jgi:hypothetical protein